MAALALAAGAAAGGVNGPAADALFEKAVAAMRQGKFDEACPAFAESQRLDPRPGTLFARAECEAKAGKPATATALFNDYLTAARELPASQLQKHKERMQLAEERKKALAPQIAWLTLSLAEGATAEVSLDGTRLLGPSLGLSLPIDPGEHLIASKTADGAREERVTLIKGERREITVALPPARRDEPEPAVASASASASSRAVTAPPRPSGAMKTSTLVAGGVGAAGLVVGVVAGALVFKQKSTVGAHCQGTRCDAAGKEAADAARPLATLSNVGFAVGVVGVAVAAFTHLGGGGDAGARGRVRLDAGATRGGAAATLSGSF